MSDDSADGTEAVVLDVLRHGRSDDDRAAFRRGQVGLAVGVEDFALYEFVMDDDADVSIGDRVRVAPDAEAGIRRVNAVAYDDLSAGAQSELEYVVEELIEANPEPFLEFYNEAGAVSLRLHQLNLLPGIGDTLRDKILDERKRGPFESFADIEERVDGLHDPTEIIVERVLQEIRGEDVKYHAFTPSGRGK
ncbi:predicted RNA-binding protein [Halarchaeum acidiphilum MH1-52-1]|uniref:Predicted RNA-binding protein n=1 Tax=Halarchaeum acidiphilum MH1-52-1 TaxID=1261545 RepID=U2YR79_9EURY|nr:DUF655 domain-containing protein [Halarchaeum acidiphilum]GAD51485.1 predicted RNA-binding protein [Halarchaeum acidiphilum MH1-52-1]